MRGGAAEGVLGVGFVPQVPLEVEHLGASDQRVVEVGGPEQRGRAEVGVERALSVGRHDDEAASGGHAVGRRRGGEVHAGRAEVVTEHRAELVVVHPSDERGGSSETTTTPTIVFAADPPEISVAGPIAAYRCSARSVSTSCMAPRSRPCSTTNVVALVAEDIDERVADADDVEPAHANRLTRTDSRHGPRHAAHRDGDAVVVRVGARPQAHARSVLTRP